MSQDAEIRRLRAELDRVAGERDRLSAELAEYGQERMREGLWLSGVRERLTAYEALWEHLDFDPQELTIAVQGGSQRGVLYPEDEAVFTAVVEARRRARP